MRTGSGVLENISELWINVRRVQGIWTISGVRELSKFEADWASDEPKNKTNLDCVYLSQEHG